MAVAQQFRLALLVQDLNLRARRRADPHREDHHPVRRQRFGGADAALLEVLAVGEQHA